MEIAAGHLRLRWDAGRRVLFARASPGERGPRMERDDLTRRLGSLVSGAASYTVIFDARGLHASSYQEKAFWFSFLASFPRPRRIAVYAADGENARAFDIFGTLARVPVRSFAAEEDALAWAMQP